MSIVYYILKNELYMLLIIVQEVDTNSCSNDSCFYHHLLGKCT